MKAPVLEAVSKELQRSITPSRVGEYKLLIQVLDRSLVYAVLNIQENCCVGIREYSLPNGTLYDLTQSLSDIIKSDDVLSVRFPEVSLSIQNNHWTLAPANSGYEKVANNLMDFDFGKTSNLRYPHKTFDKLNPLTVLNFYGYPNDVVGIFRVLHQKVKLRHYATSLIMGQNSLTRDSDEYKVFLDFGHKRLILTVFAGKKLVISNSFECESVEDFLYFSMLGISECKVPTTSLRIYVSGTTPDLSQVVNALTPYVWEVKYLDVSKILPLAPDISRLRTYKYSSLLSLHLCA